MKVGDILKKILVVEDDRNTNQVITEFLKDSSLSVISVFDGDAAILSLYENKVDLCILDIMLPKKNGMEVLEEIRRISDIPIIMLTALGDEFTQIKAFDLQADEYVTKPFSPAVLVKRVNALLKRSNPIENSVITLGDLLIDFSAYSVTKHGQIINFTTKEIELLKMLIENEGVVLARQQILDKVWGRDVFSKDRTVDTHIKNIRKKLNIDCILTIKNIGYKFEMIK